MVVSSEETCNNCLFVKVFNYFLIVVTKYLISAKSNCISALPYSIYLICNVEGHSAIQLKIKLLYHLG